MSQSRPGFDLFLISGLILFLELACIRWFPAHVLFLTFFTNTVLLACFVGMSVGCLLADRPVRLIDRTPMLLTLALLTGLVVVVFDSSFRKYVDVATQANPDVVFFGTEADVNRLAEFNLPVEVVMAVFFVLIALVMVGPGQEMGRAFTRVPSRPRAYALNLLGSLAGIGLFAACSMLRLPPPVWFGVCGLGIAYLVAQRGVGEPPARTFGYALLGLSLLATIPTSGWMPVSFTIAEITWSPYYRIDHHPKKGEVVTNLIGHQQIRPREQTGIEMYSFPYLFQRDVTTAAGAPAIPAYKRVLIIGAGSGNDLSRSLYWVGPDAKIDAVEIDPVIQSIGAKNHPDKPYQDPRVSIHLNDGRNFLRKAPDAEYDLVVFALVDSLVLHSGYSTLRLESFLFTQESMRDVRRVLKPTGLAAVYNYFRQGWIAARLRDMMRAEFNSDPVVLTDPPLDEVRLDTSGGGLFTGFFAGSPDVTGALRASFASAGDSYWIPTDKGITRDSPARFQAASPVPAPSFWVRAFRATGLGSPGSAAAPPEKSPWIRLRPAKVAESPADLRKATDDWPFLYTRQPGIPGLTWRGMGIMVTLSLLLWWALSTKVAPAVGGSAGAANDGGLLLRSFLLGAGFMLIETKAVVQMALLFGSTWAVNTVVFAAILVMALAGNLFAGWARPKTLWPYYVGLFAALGASLLIPLESFLGLERGVQIAAACALVFAPVAFAGVIFPTSFARAPRPDRFFGANVAGALAGGLAENLSMVVGFHYLLLVAAAVYAASGLFGSASAPTPADGKRV